VLPGRLTVEPPQIDVRRPPEQGASPPEATERPAADARLRSLVQAPEVRIGAVVALAVVAGLVVWLLARDNEKATSRADLGSAHAVSARDLAALPATVNHPVYWVGPMRGFTYELTQTTDGRIYIRYLPAGVSVGTDQPKYLTVATYPVSNALGAVRGIAKRLRVTASRLEGGGLAVQDTKHPTSVYLAYRGSDYQVEVYDPSPARALQLVLSGKVTALESTRPTHARPRAVTVQQLQALASSVGHPVYWVGPRAGTIYELTETSDGRIYVRYLPRGAEVDDPKPHTTVGTYPFRNPVAAIGRVARQTGGQTFSIDRGGLATVDASHPTSVYVAFPGSDYQIEVFDPSAARARRLVTSGLVVPVR
jgi:hypothetical protein